MQKISKKRVLATAVLMALLLSLFAVGAIAADEAAVVSDYDTALEYVDGYADNVVADEDFGTNLSSARGFI